MKKNPIITYLFNFVFGISGTVSLTLLFSIPLLYLFMLVQKTYQTVNLPIGTVMKNYGQLLLYLVSPLVTKLQMTDFPTSINAAEHFYECKILFQIAVTLFIIGAIILYVVHHSRKYRDLFTLDKTSALVFMILPLAILPFAMVNFDSFFITFHHLLFNNNNWLFDPATDPIINVLTEGFFAGCFAVAGILYELYFAQFLLKTK